MERIINYRWFLTLSVILIITISGCSQENGEATDELINNLVKYDTDDAYTSWEDQEAISIHLDGKEVIAEENDSVLVSQNQINIYTSGTYVIDGTLEDGQIVVDAEDSGTVRLILNGVSLQSSTSAPIYIKQAEKTVISLEEDTQNTLTDATEYVYADEETDEPEATIFSKDDLTINGSGTLKINGNYNDGITSRDALKIIGGTINITSIDDGIVGRDLFAMKKASITIDAKGDGVKSSNDEDESKGNIILENGELNIKAGGDGIQAEKSVYGIDGKYSIISGGGSPEEIEGTTTDFDRMGEIPNGENPPENMPQMPSNTDRSDLPEGDFPSNGGDSPQASSQNKDETEDTESTKGIKANEEIHILNGSFTIDSFDDALHSNKNLVISDGDLFLSTGDDAIHADGDVQIENGTIDVKKSYEGLEGLNITITGGDIHIHAEDDGVNVNSSSNYANMPGMSNTDTETTSESNEETTETGELLIEDGYLYVDANGDGLDSNTSITMTGGIVLVYGPSSSGNGSLDYDQSFNIEGGTLVAVGSSGMAQGVSEDSSQSTIMMTYSEIQNAETTLYLENSNGEKILAIEPEKDFQTILISSEDLQQGKNYILYNGGSITGDKVDGVYENADYQEGTQAIEFTLNTAMTYLNEEGVTEQQTNPKGGRWGQRKDFNQ